jgi:pectinesterase
MKKLLTALFAIVLSATAAMAANKYDNPDTIVVARDGTGEFRNISEAIEVCRAFMDYHKVIYVKRGTYKEKLEIPTHLTNIEICGEDALTTIITWDDHANIMMPSAYDPIAIERHPTADTQHPVTTTPSAPSEHSL